MNNVAMELDLIEELRLRRWARENYVPHDQRQPTWHPIIHEEMSKKDVEELEHEPPRYAWGPRCLEVS